MCDPFGNNFFTGPIYFDKLADMMRVEAWADSFIFDSSKFEVKSNNVFLETPNSIGLQEGGASPTRVVEYKESVQLGYQSEERATVKTSFTGRMNERKCHLHNGFYLGVDFMDGRLSYRLFVIYKDAVSLLRDNTATVDITGDIIAQDAYQAFTLYTNSYEDILEFVKKSGKEHLVGGYKTIIKNHILDYYQKNATAANLKAIYEQAPLYVLQEIPHELKVHDFEPLLKYDDSGDWWFDGWWKDTSDAVVRLLGSYKPTELHLLYDYLYSKPELLFELYRYSNHNAATICQILQTMQMMVDFGILKPAIAPQTVATFHNGVGYEIDSDIMQGESDKVNLNNYTIIQVPGPISSPTGLTTNKVSARGDTLIQGSYHPMDLIELITHHADGTTSTQIVPVLYVKLLADTEEWADVLAFVRVAGDLLAIIIAVATAGTASPLMAALLLLEGGLATADLGVMAFEKEIQEMEGGKEFLQAWNIIMLAGVATAAPALVRGALKLGLSLLRTAPASVRAFFKQCMTKLILEMNIAGFDPKKVKSVIFGAEEVFTNLSHLNQFQLTRLEDAGVAFVKGLDKEGKISGVMAYYKGEVIVKALDEIQARDILERLLGQTGSSLINSLDEMAAGVVTTSIMKRKIPMSFIEALKSMGKKESEIIEYFTRYHNDFGRIFLRQIEELVFKNPKLTETDAFVLWGYTTNFFYWDMNHWLRQGLYKSRTAHISRLLSNALAKVPKYSGSAYRALEITGENLTAFLQKHEKGKKVVFNDFASCGSSKEASFFDRSWKNVLLTLEVKNAPIISDFSDGIKIRGYAKEELLLLRGKEFIVDDTALIEGKYLIMLKEI